MNRRRSIPGALLGASLPLALLLSPGRADIIGTWNNFQDWEYTTTQMPDLDQGRGGALLLPDNCGPFAPCAAPPNCGPGFMYCAPTAATNLLLYASHHGSPGLLNPAKGWSAPAGFAPAPGNWFAWRAGPAGVNPFFGHGTSNVQKMGALMGTGGCLGTFSNGTYWGLRQAFGPGFDVHGYLSTPYYTPTLNRVGQAGMQRGAMLVVVGYYQIVGQALGFPVVVRTGGHVMTLSRARRLGNNCWAWCRDPADDLLPLPTPAGVLASQSTFQDRAFTAFDGWVVYAQPGFPLHFRFMTSFVGPGPATPGKLLLLDGFYTVRPRAALARKAFQGALQPVPALQRIEPAAWTGAPEVDEWVLSPSGTDILDYAQFGAGAAVVMLTAPQKKGGPAQVWLVNQFTNESEMVAEIEGATSLVAGMPPDVWVHAGDAIHLVWLDPTEAEYPGGNAPGALVDQITLPAPADLVRFDDFNRRLVAFDLTARVVHIITPANPPVIETRALPAEFPVGASMLGDVEVLEDAAGVFVASVEGSSTLIELDLSDPVTVSATLSVGAFETVADVAISDGRLFVSGAGQVKEFQRSAEGVWVEVNDGDFQTTEVEDAFKVVRSQTNYDPELHHDEDFFHINPPDLVPGEPVPSCAGDLDFDGDVDVLDLTTLVMRWGAVPGPFMYDAADLDLDFEVDTGDLVLLILNWGPCPMAP